MSFAIEVPGEASPLTLDTVLYALQSASSNDYTQRRAAELQLESWKPHAGYYPSLQVCSSYKMPLLSAQTAN